MPKAPIRILLVEDDATDALAVREGLAHASDATFDVTTIDTLQAATQLLASQSFEVALLDLSLPDSSGLPTFEQLHAAAPTLPIVVFSNHDNETLALQAVRAGAQDYLIKGQANGQLPRAVRYARARAETENQLRQSEERLRLSTELAKVAVWEYDVLANEMARSANHDALYGITGQGKWKAETFLDATHPEDRVKVFPIIQASIAAGGPDYYGFDFRVFRPDGAMIWLNVIGQVVKRDAKGNGLLVRGCLSDVTERKQTEEALRQSEANLAAAQARAQIGTWHVDLATNQVTGTPESFHILGLDPARKLTVSDIVALVHPDDLESYKDSFHRAKAGPLQIQQDIRIIRPDGQPRWLDRRFEVICDKAGKPVSIAGTSQDITKRKETEAHLRESEERFRELAENIGEVFWMSDPTKMKVLYVSPAYEQIWGRTCQSVYDSPQAWLEAICPEDRDRIRAALPKQAHGAYDEEYQIIRPDGSQRSIHDKAFPIKDETGAVTRIVGVAKDITEYQQLEAQFRQAQKMEAIGTLAGGIAHDFNNILGAVQGYAQLVKDEIKDNQVAVEYIEAVLQGAHRATDLVKQIVSFSRQHDTLYGQVRLQTIVGEALHLLRATIPTTIEIESSLEKEAPAILADPTQIHQVVMNLCTNAWQAMKGRPGRLEVRVERVTLDTAFIETHPELSQAGEHLRLTIADNGCGMAPETINRIFEPFFTTKEIGEGTGLGLSVVHGVMQRHHGAITVQSEPNVGTRFQLYFPKHQGTAHPENSPPASITPIFQNARVMLVDDESTFRQMGKIILEKAGCLVQIFPSSVEALAAARLKPNDFDIVVTDLAMPGISGIDFAETLRFIRPDIPIIITSGFFDPPTEKRISALGNQTMLPKPFSVESLTQMVQKALSTSGKS